MVKVFSEGSKERLSKKACDSGRAEARVKAQEGFSHLCRVYTVSNSAVVSCIPEINTSTDYNTVQ
jgi:hypothetical protein